MDETLVEGCVSREARFWTIIALLVAIFSAWVGYLQLTLAAKQTPLDAQLSKNGADSEGRNSPVAVPKSDPIQRRAESSAAMSEPTITQGSPIPQRTVVPATTQPFAFRSQLPSRIDIIWCRSGLSLVFPVGGDFDSNEPRAYKISEGLENLTAAKITVASAPAGTGILLHNSVKYNATNVEAAKELAQFAKYKTGKKFEIASSPSPYQEDMILLLVCD